MPELEREREIAKRGREGPGALRQWRRRSRMKEVGWEASLGWPYEGG